MKILPLSVSDVSPQNKSEIIRYLLSASGTSRNDAANALGLSSATVGKIASAMLSERLLEAETVSGHRGRSHEALYPNSELCALLITVNENVCRATLLSPNGTQRVVRTYHRNDSLEYGEAVTVFLSTVQREIADLPKDDIFGVYVAYDGKSLKELSSNAETLLGLTIDIEVPYSEALGAAFGRRKSDGLALCIDIGKKKITPRLFLGSKYLSENAIGYIPSDPDEHLIADEYSIAIELSEYLASLFKTVIPSSLAINSDIVTADKKFIDLVMQKTAQKTDIEAGKLPSVISQKDMSLIAEAALESCVRLFAKRLAGIE